MDKIVKMIWLAIGGVVIYFAYASGILSGLL